MGTGTREAQGRSHMVTEGQPPPGDGPGGGHSPTPSKGARPRDTVTSGLWPPVTGRSPSVWCVLQRLQGLPTRPPDHPEWAPLTALLCQPPTSQLGGKKDRSSYIFCFCTYL